MENKWIQTQSLQNLIDFEPFLLLLSLLLLAWVFYKGFLKGVSESRHQSIRGHFSKLIRNYIVLALLFSLYLLFNSEHFSHPSLRKLVPYLAIMTFCWGGMIFVKVSRLIILQYLFLGSMRAGVPLLIVNIFSLMMSVILTLWGVSQIFNLQIGPLLATSAAFSVILGLALQDTLGNLFAGIALQLDHNFEIGDWLEIYHGSQKTIGQVKEMTWRATTLIGWTDEVIVLPNRLMAGSQIANYQAGDTPFTRNQIFRLPYDVDVELAKKCLLHSLDRVPEIRKYPEPLCLITEHTESWLTFKLIFYIDNYGSQFVIGDKVVTEAWKALHQAGIHGARTTYNIVEQKM